MSTVITGVSSMATRVILGELSGRYQDASGIEVAIRSMGGVDAAKLIRAGEVTDVVVLASGVMSQLEAEGHLLAGSIRGFTRSGMAIVVRSGAPHPDIGNEAAVQRAVGAARKVGYSTGPSGDHLLQLCTGWGLLPEGADRMVKAPPGVPVGSLVAQGDADLGFQQLSEFLGVDGIEIVGPLPPEIQAVTVFAAGVCSASSRPDEARALIAYLASPETADLKRRHGMDPA
ncbi:MAG TPA: substrate-binding domain-containing protein [Caulobacteraceae bacterium]